MSDKAGNAIEPMAPGIRRNMLLLTTLFISIMAAIDMTIVTVALPYMAGNLGATPDEITWVVTMFAVGQAIVIGITGHLSRLFGRKQLAIISVTGFVLSSMACGLSGSLDEIVIFRLIQGAFCGPLIPLSQSMLIDAFPAQERNRVLSFWAMGIMGGPAAGPALGGYLAENLDWRWNFWVNLPVGVVALLLISRYVRVVKPQAVRTDWVGLLLLVLFLIGLQVALDQGNRLDWFSSLEMQLLAAMALVAFAALVARGLVLGDRNIINLTIFRDLNFVGCATLIGVLGSLFLALLILTPQMFIDLYQWEVVTAGFIIGSYGIAAFTGALLSSRLVKLLGIRAMVVLSCLLLAGGWFIFSRTSLEAGPLQVILPGVIIEFGLMLVFPLLAAQAFSGLSPQLRDEAAGLFNLTKTLGFAAGTTLVATLVYRGSQANWHAQVGMLNHAHPGYRHYLQSSGLTDHSLQAGAELGSLLQTQTGMVAMIQTMEVLAVLALCAMPLALLLRSGKS